MRSTAPASNVKPDYVPLTIRQRMRRLMRAPACVPARRVLCNPHIAPDYDAATQARVWAAINARLYTNTTA